MTIINNNDIKIRNCIYGFKCEQIWDQMQFTKRENVRFCSSCEKEVFFVEKKGQLFKSIQLNRCVAIRTSTPEGFEVITSGYIDSYIES